MRRPTLPTVHLREHFPQESPVVAKGRAFTALMILIIELTAHALEMTTMALVMVVGTFGRDLWDAIEFCWRTCEAAARKLERKIEEEL